MERKVTVQRNLIIAGIILLAIVSRFIPHIPNFVPIAAIALFAGTYFMKRKWAYLSVLTIMVFSDLILQIGFWAGKSEFPGFHNSMAFVYVGYLLFVFLGTKNVGKNLLPKSLGLVLVGSLAFFLFTNFGVWLTGTMYDKSITGLINCFTAAIPFFRTTIAANLIYTFALFGTFELITNLNPSLKLSTVKA